MKTVTKKNFTTLCHSPTYAPKKVELTQNAETHERKVKKSNIFILLTNNILQTKNLTLNELVCGFLIFCHYRTMIEKVSRIDLIRKAHAVALAEKGDIELEGVLSTDKGDVLDEAQHLDALDHVEVVDVDADENLVDMDAVSPAMRAMFTN